MSVSNGNVALVIGEDGVSLSDTLNLDSVRVVPSLLDYNLLSVAQITVVLHCLVIFWPSFCVFKNIRTGKTIGYGIRHREALLLGADIEQFLNVDSSSCSGRKSGG